VEIMGGINQKLLKVLVAVIVIALSFGVGYYLNTQNASQTSTTTNSATPTTAKVLSAFETTMMEFQILSIKMMTTTVPLM